MGIKVLSVFKRLLACPAIGALAVGPLVLSALEPNFASVADETFCDRVLALGVLRTIHTPPGKQAREMRRPDAEHLRCQDVIYTHLKVRNRAFQPPCEAVDNFAQKHARLSEGVKEFHRLVCPDVSSAHTRAGRAETACGLSKRAWRK